MKCNICNEKTEDIEKLNDTILDRFKRYSFAVDEKLYGKTIKVCRKCFLKV